MYSNGYSRYSDRSVIGKVAVGGMQQLSSHIHVHA